MSTQEPARRFVWRSSDIRIVRADKAEEDAKASPPDTGKG